jgi:predicted DNA-binding transcriptional regulator AlpA
MAVEDENAVGGTTRPIGWRLAEVDDWLARKELLRDAGV